MKPTVLLIDENRAVTEIVRALLERNGYGIELAGADVNILKVLDELPIDVIVTDVQLTGTDGYALARAVRADPATADLPIIFLTALSSLEDEFEGYLSGADAYLTKPFRARDLLSALDDVLNRKTLSTSSGRLAVVQDVARVLACVPEERERLVRNAMKQAGFELEFEPDLSRAFSRVDRERFHLLICDTAKDADAVKQVREFLSHFALAVPVIFLHRKDAPPNVPANERQLGAVRVPTTAGELSEVVRRAIVDFSGPP